MAAARLLAQISQTFMVRVVGVGLGLMSTVMLARILGPEGRGLFAVATVITAVGVQIAVLGLNSANTYFVAREPEQAPQLIANSIWVALLGGGSVGLFTLCVEWLWPGTLPAGGVLLVVALLGIPVALAFQLLQAILISVHSVSAYNRAEMVGRVLPVVLIGLFFFAHQRAVETYYMVSVVTSAVTAGLVLKWLGVAGKRVWRPSLALWRSQLGYGLRAYIASLLAYLVLRIDIVMVADISGSEEAGYYSLAVGMGDMLYLLPMAVGSVLFPHLSGIADRRKKWQVMRGLLSKTLMLSVLASAAAMLLAGPAIDLLFGVDFLPAVAPFRVIAVAIVLFGLNSILSNYIAADGMPVIITIFWAMAAGINVGLNLLAIPEWGGVGAAWVSLLTYLMIFLIQWVYVVAKRA